MSQRLIRLRLSGWMVQLVQAVLERLPEQLGKTLLLPAELLPQDDEDLREAWQQSLLEQMEYDLSFLRKTLARLGSNGIADLDRQGAETFLRSVTAVRLALQRTALADLPDHDLQNDSINIETLPEPAQPAYACYLLLADIQGQVIAQLDQNDLSEAGAGASADADAPQAPDRTEEHDRTTERDAPDFPDEPDQSR